MSAIEAASLNTAAAQSDEPNTLARLFLEDFVVTALLSSGRALRAGELAAKAEGFSPSRQALNEALGDSRRVKHEGRDWDLQWRLRRRGLSREERSRQPLEGMLNEILSETGRPLPLPVIAREISLMRNEYAPEMRASVANVLRSSRSTVEISTDVFIHRDFVLETGASTEDLLVRENRLAADPDFRELLEKADPVGNTLTERALSLLKSAGRPLNTRTIAFFVRRAAPAGFNAREMAAALNDRTKFQPMLDGMVASKDQLSSLRNAAQALLAEFGGHARTTVDVAALLRQRVAANEVIAPKDEDVEELKRAARASDGQPISLINVLMDVWEMEPDDPRFVPSLQGLNDALRKDTAFMPVGIGRYLSRDAVPDYLGTVPEALRPVLLEMRNPETDEAMDFEMSDEGLEGDCIEFVHAPQWEDIAEEVEVKMARRTSGEPPTATRYVVLNHHLRAGTIKLRRMDEEFFELSGGLGRVGLRAKENNENLVAWTSRESGLLYGLGTWFADKLPPSGGVLEFEREGNGYTIDIAEPDKLTLVTPQRAEELEALRESATFLSLFELLQKVMLDSPNMELPTIWAQVNIVRRTSKRVMCSVLSGYHCFYYKQKGPTQHLWRFDEAKLDQGFKRNKRKFVRR